MKHLHQILYIFVFLFGIAASMLIFQLFRKSNNLYINTDQTAVVKQMQKLNRLETATFTIEKIIDAGTKGNALQEILYGDKILLIAHGQVIAGFDFSKISKDDIAVSDKKLTIRLEKPEILVTKLDSEKTRVYDRKQGLLSKGDKDLETQARFAAEKSIKEAACQEHILEVASENAKKQLTALFESLGFTEVTLQIPKGSC